MDTKMHSKYHAWSLMDPRPVCFFDQHTGVDLAVWNGVYMTRSQALMIACEKYLNIWPTPTMKERAWKHFTRAYYANAFGHRQWDGTLNRLNHGAEHYNVLKKMLGEHLQKMPSYSGADVLKWFNYHKERAEWTNK